MKFTRCWVPVVLRFKHRLVSAVIHKAFLLSNGFKVLIFGSTALSVESLNLASQKELWKAE